MIKLAWKNIWRNKIRSSIILGAIAIGLFSGTYLAAFLNGWMYGTVQSDIDADLSYIQIHDTAFLANCDIERYFLRSDVAGIENAEISQRLCLQGMLSSANNAIGIMAKAVNPQDEMKASKLWRNIPDSLGTFLNAEIRNPIVLSRKAAEKLKVKLKSKIVFSFQNRNGEMQSVAFRVCGIFSTSNTLFDESTVFVHYDDIFALTALPENAVNEVAVSVSDIKTGDEITPKIKEMYPKLSVQSWREINPTLAMSLAWTDIFCVVILGIFLFALSFGIINTMLMAVLERTGELGMLKAIGMNNKRIFLMIMLETLFLTVLGSIIGVILAVAILVPSLKSGVDLTFMMGNSFEDYGFSSVVYPILEIKTFIQISILVFVAGILSAIYPAIKALKIDIIKAIKNQ
ncbi:MAG: FtsX-like permease family protein [Prevotellaceae bacterium]|jgi:ABC-type lipoprotein release transport system permease subunit|nr:FtsX-like permease family protein [Prevotellaceae bacterium]